MAWFVVKPINWNAGFEPALPAYRAGALPTELIPGRLGAHRTLGTHRAMGSVSAPDGHQRTRTMERRTPPNLCLAGSPAVEATTTIFSSPPLDSLSSVHKKSPVRQSDQGFFGAWKDALRIASRKIVEGQRMLVSPSWADGLSQRDRGACGNGHAVGNALMKPAGLDVPESTCPTRRMPQSRKGARL